MGEVPCVIVNVQRAGQALRFIAQAVLRRAIHPVYPLVLS